MKIIDYIPYYIRFDSEFGCKYCVIRYASLFMKLQGTSLIVIFVPVARMANKLFFGRVQRFLCDKRPPQLASRKIFVKPQVPPRAVQIRRVCFTARRCTDQKLIDSMTYEKISDDALDELSEYLDDCFQEIDVEELDVNLSSGVLTINLGNSIGTYVINKQSPNRQIWLSSPISGPKRYDLVDGKWIYSHDGSNLHELLQNEFAENLNFSFDMKNLQYYHFTKK